MTFRIFRNSTTADASDSNDNFYHVAQGSVLPMQGTSLGNTTGAVDLGSSTYNWETGYFNSIPSLLLESNGITFDHLATNTLENTTTSITFDGLNSDNDVEYFLHFYIINRTSTANQVNLCVNTTTNVFSGISVFCSIGVLGSTSTTFIYEQGVVTDTALFTWGYINVFSLSDYAKAITVNGFTDGYEKSVGRPFFNTKGLGAGGVQTVTSLILNCAAGSLEPGTSISLYSKGI